MGVAVKAIAAGIMIGAAFRFFSNDISKGLGCAALALGLWALFDVIEKSR
jgi:hypothetical protein